MGIVVIGAVFVDIKGYMYRTVTRLLAGDIEECFWISHDEQIKKLKN